MLACASANCEVHAHASYIVHHLSPLVKQKKTKFINCHCTVSSDHFPRSASLSLEGIFRFLDDQQRVTSERTVSVGVGSGDVVETGCFVCSAVLLSVSGK